VSLHFSVLSLDLHRCHAGVDLSPLVFGTLAVWGARGMPEDMLSLAADRRRLRL
jgi:hypothetical protein